MTGYMLHGLGDCTPDHNCGCNPVPYVPPKRPYRRALMRVSEVAKIFEVADYTVREWLKDGKIEGSKTPGGQWRIARTEVERFANEIYGEKD